MAADPVPSRLGLPSGYGLPEDSPLLEWHGVNERLAAALHYWLALVLRDGRPITRPIDGMWVNNCLYFSGDRESLWRRALEANPEASLHLEDGERAVILEGRVGKTTPDAALAATLAAQANAKYEWADAPDSAYQAESLIFRPRKAMAWTLLYKDATRFTFA